MTFIQVPQGIRKIKLVLYRVQQEEWTRNCDSEGRKRNKL